MTIAEILLGAALVPMILTSAIASGSETILFGLSQADRLWLRRERPQTAAIVDTLLEEPRQLLITILLANMTANTLYFVTTSVLLIRLSESWLLSAAISVVTLILLVLFGEILPKLAANTARRRLVGASARIVRAPHVLLAPLRLSLDRGVVAPLARLVGGGDVIGLSVREIDDALTTAGRHGLIDERARDVLARVVRLGGLRVRDVMTPRVDVVAVRVGATPAEVARASAAAGLTRLVVHRGDLDEVEGILDVRSLLLDPRGERASIAAHTRRALFVPAVASVEQLLHLLREKGRQIAIVVDEFGGTEGVASLEDAVEEIVGDIAAPGEAPIPLPEPTPDGRWRIRGETPAADFSRWFSLDLGPDAPATAGGVLLEQLGREPHRGDRAVTNGMTIEVESVSRGRILSLLVDRAPESSS